MIKVDNRKCINKISKSSFKGNKLRNIFTIAAIILTTVMFTTLFTVGMSMMSSVEQSTMRQVGGSAHGTFKYLTEEQYNKLKANESVREMEYSIIIGFAENQQLKKHPCEIRYGTDREAELMFSSPEEGKMPELYDEIVMDTLTLDSLDIPHELGKDITLEYSLNGKNIRDTFKLSGYYEGDKAAPSSQIWISKGYLDSKLKELDNNEENTYIGKYNADVVFNNSFNIDGKMNDVIRESGYDEGSIDYGVNWAYTFSNPDMSSMLFVLGSLILILICGYLIIYNIFYISICRDIHFYGLLKTIGTTSNQIKKIIRKQALTLSFIGIPIGLLCGYVVAVIITPIFLGQLSLIVTTTSASPVIFIGSALFTLMTVFISTRKPAKEAGKVSPIEALKSSEVKDNRKRKTKKSTRGNLFRMAISNVLRNRKKSVIVTLSLSLGLIILNCAYSIANSFDMDSYINLNISTDFAVADSVYFNNYIGYNGEETLTDDFLKELSSKQGVSTIGNIRFEKFNYKIDDLLKGRIINILTSYKDEFRKEDLEEINSNLESGEMPVQIYGMDSLGLDKLTVMEGEIDEEKLNSGEYIIVSPFSVDNGDVFYNVGDKITVNYEDGIKEYEVMAVAGGIWFFKFRFSLMPLLICIPIFFILGGIIPVICYKCTSKASIVERLRESMD